MIQKGDQVLYRQALRRPEDGQSIKTGNVISIQGSKALVQFPLENIRRTVEVAQLQLSSERYTGRSSVQFNPVQRH